VRFIVKIDSITQSLCLWQHVQNGLSYLGKETLPTLCRNKAKLCLASELLEQINISCYTEYKVFGPSLIKNRFIGLTQAHTIMYFFLENGCNDQYDGATDTLCLRASAYPETYEDAQTRCVLEGGQLVQDYSPQIHVR